MINTYKVALDPGHGSNTPGKRSSDGKFLEWEFNSDMVKRITKKLEGYQSISVINVKGNVDTDTPLGTRCRTANTNNCDIYISIHANAASATSAEGWEAWVYSDKDKTGKLATTIHKYYTSIITNVKDRGIKVDPDFYVLNSTSMPAIIIEHAFFTNEKEKNMMLTDAYRDKAATACAKAIVELAGLSWVTTSSTVDDNGKVTNGSNSSAITCPDWKAVGEKWLEDNKIITSYHNPLETVDMGTLGVILQNYTKFLNK